jgi:hypothetical protein
MVVMGMDGTGESEFKPVLVVPAGRGSGREEGMQHGVSDMVYEQLSKSLTRLS